MWQAIGTNIVVRKTSLLVIDEYSNYFYFLKTTNMLNSHNNLISICLIVWLECHKWPQQMSSWGMTWTLSIHLFAYFYQTKTLGSSSMAARGASTTRCLNLFFMSEWLVYSLLSYICYTLSGWKPVGLFICSVQPLLLVTWVGIAFSYWFVSWLGTVSPTLIWCLTWQARRNNFTYQLSTVWVSGLISSLTLW